VRINSYASVALAFRSLCLGHGAFVSRKRFADIDGFSKGAVRLVAYITFIAFVGFKVALTDARNRSLLAQSH
jgi:hypothetical protein